MEIPSNFKQNDCVKGEKYETADKSIFLFDKYERFVELVSRGFTKSWVGQVASRSPINRHALDLTVSM